MTQNSWRKNVQPLPNFSSTAPSLTGRKFRRIIGRTIVLRLFSVECYRATASFCRLVYVNTVHLQRVVIFHESSRNIAFVYWKNCAVLLLFRIISCEPSIYSVEFSVKFSQVESRHETWPEKEQKSSVIIFDKSGCSYVFFEGQTVTEIDFEWLYNVYNINDVIMRKSLWIAIVQLWTRGSWGVGQEGVREGLEAIDSIDHLQRSQALSEGSYV